jgi:predicted phosphatase
MIVNLNAPFVDLDNKPVKDNAGVELILSKFLSNAIFNNDAKELGKPISVHAWALNLHSTGEIEVTAKELDAFVEYITTNPGMSTGMKAQLIACFNKAAEQK